MPRTKLRNCRRCCGNCWAGPGAGLRAEMDAQSAPSPSPAAPQRPGACQELQELKVSGQPPGLSWNLTSSLPSPFL